MTNYGTPGGAGPDPWQGQRPEDTYGPPAGGPNAWPEPIGPYPQQGGQRPDPGAAPGPGYGGQPGYGPDPGYRPGPGYDAEPAYGSDQGYGAAPGYGSDPYRTPAAGQPGPGAPRFGYAGAPERKRSRWPLIAVLAAVLVLVIAGAAALFLLPGDDDPAPTAGPTEPAPAAVESTDPTGAPEPVPSVSSAPAPESSADPRFAKVGQCVRNDAPAGSKPKLAISECGSKTYQVLRRVDGATTGEKDAAAKCAKVEGYTNWYFFDSELDTLDFVLCLKQR